MDTKTTTPALGDRQTWDILVPRIFPRSAAFTQIFFAGVALQTPSAGVLQIQRTTYNQKLSLLFC